MAEKEEEHEQDEEELAITPVSEETDIEPAEETVDEVKMDQRPRPTFGQVMRRIFIAILRLIIIVAVIAGLGAVIYYGVPYIYQQYIRPVEQNSSQLSGLEIRQSQSEIELVELQTRLATLEADQTSNTESITDANSRIETLEGASAQRSESLAELTYQSDLLRAMELLSRARLFLYQSNFGFARLDVQVARDILAEMQSTAPESKQQDISEALFRLDLVLKNLPTFPVAASDDLDIAWQVLMSGYPAPLPTATSTPIPTTPPDETATSIPDLTTTPAAAP